MRLLHFIIQRSIQRVKPARKNSIENRSESTNKNRSGRGNARHLAPLPLSSRSGNRQLRSQPLCLVRDRGGTARIATNQASLARYEAQRNVCLLWRAGESAALQAATASALAQDI